MISSMYWMVPTISGLIVGGFSMGALASMTGGITGRTAKGEAVGAEMGTGSWQSGNARMNNTAMNKHDTAMLSSIGSMSNVAQSYQGNFGGTHTDQTSVRTTSASGNTGAMLQGISEQLGVLGGVNTNVGSNFVGNREKNVYADGSHSQKGTFHAVGADGSNVTFTGDHRFDKNGKHISTDNASFRSEGANGVLSGNVDLQSGQVVGGTIKRNDGQTLEFSKGADGSVIGTSKSQDGTYVTMSADENGNMNKLIDAGTAQYSFMDNKATKEAISKAVTQSFDQKLTDSINKAIENGMEQVASTGTKTSDGKQGSETTTGTPMKAAAFIGKSLEGIPFVGKLGSAVIDGLTKAITTEWSQGSTFSYSRDGQLTMTSKEGTKTSFSLDSSTTKSINEQLSKMESEETGKALQSKESMLKQFSHDLKEGNVSLMDSSKYLSENADRYMQTFSGNLDTGLLQKFDDAFKNTSNAINAGKGTITASQTALQGVQDDQIALVNGEKGVVEDRIDLVKEKTGLTADITGTVAGGSAGKALVEKKIADELARETAKKTIYKEGAEAGQDRLGTMNKEAAAATEARQAREAAAFKADQDATRKAMEKSNGTPPSTDTSTLNQNITNAKVFDKAKMTGVW